MKKKDALHTHPGVEQRVAQALCRYGIETFLPEISFSEVNQRQRRAPLFPGYLFVYIDLNVDDPIRWNWITGVKCIVSYGDWPVPVPDEIIRLIRQKLKGLKVQVIDSARQFTPGDLVRINDGPFRAMLGDFEGQSHSVLAFTNYYLD